MSKRSLWILIGVVVGVAVAIVTAIFVTGLLLATDAKDGDEICQREARADSCTDLTPEVIGDLMQMELPDSVTVESSEYQQFQDWHLEATFVVPPEDVAAWEETLGSYPAPTTEQCLGKPNLGPDQVCAMISAEEGDGEQRSFIRADQADGSVKVAVEAIGF